MFGREHTPLSVHMGEGGCKLIAEYKCGVPNVPCVLCALSSRASCDCETSATAHVLTALADIQSRSAQGCIHNPADKTGCYKL